MLHRDVKASFVYHFADCEYCGKRFANHSKTRFCSNECKSAHAIGRNGDTDGIVEPRNQQEQKAMDELIKQRCEEVKKHALEFVNDRTPLDDSPQAEIRMRRFLRLRRKNGRFINDQGPKETSMRVMTKTGVTTRHKNHKKDNE